LKSPRIYFTDLGIRNILLGITELALLDKLESAGDVAGKPGCRTDSGGSITHPQSGPILHYWRTKAKEEVDLVVVTPQMLLPHRD